MEDISVIIPIHKMGEQDKELFANALSSLNNQKVLPEAIILVVPEGEKEIIKFLKSYKGDNVKNIEKIITVVENPGKTDFASQMNYGVSQAKTEWINFMEMDDEMSNIWIKNVKEYTQFYPEVEIFSPIVIDVNEGNQFLNLTNEPVWAKDFSEELGFIDHDIALAYQNFNIVGMAVKKDAYEDFGGLKTSIKLYFIYEFILRMTLNSIKIMVIPKFGYKHYNLREDSLFKSYQDGMNPVESKWWLAQAKKEYHFTKDREITYSE